MARSKPECLPDHDTFSSVSRCWYNPGSRVTKGDDRLSGYSADEAYILLGSFLYLHSWTPIASKCNADELKRGSKLTQRGGMAMAVLALHIEMTRESDLEQT